MDDLNFRRNVDPQARRQAAKDALELNGLRENVKICEENRNKAEQKLYGERINLSNAIGALEAARNALSEAQEDIDADYLPENAQPRARIQKRDNAAIVRH
jgi:hypothetical protein